MSDTKISDFLQVDGGDISNITAIAAVGTASGGATGQNVKISGDELETSLALDVTQLTKNIGANDQVLKIVNNAPAWAASTDDDTTYTLLVPNATTDIALNGSDASSASISILGGDVMSVVRDSGSELTLDHDDVTRTDTASSASPAAGGTFTCIDSVTTSTEGHITAANVKTVTLPAAGGGGIDFSGLNIATIKANLANAIQDQYGTAITVTAGANISNGEIVIWDYSNGTVRAQKPNSLPQQNQIIGVAIEDITSGNDGKVLIYGYATIKSAYSASGDFLNETNTFNIANSDGLITTLPTSANDYITFEETVTGNNINSSSIFDAGAGNTVKMEIVDFDFEGTTTPYDRMQILVGSTQGALSAAALTPGITGSSGLSANNGWKVFPNFFGSSTDTNGPLASGNAFPSDPGVTSGGQTGPDIGDVFDLGQRYAQFDFVSDGSGSSSFELKLTSSQAVVITDTTPGAGIYLDGTNFEQGTNNISTNRFIGTAAGGSFTNNAMVILVAPPRV